MSRSTHEEIAAKVLDEIHEHGLGLREDEEEEEEEDLTFEKITKMRYLDGVVREALRLFPPVPLDPKWCVNADTLPSGYQIPHGTLVTYLVYVMGRDPSLWPEPMKVQPERWFNPSMPSAYKFPVFQVNLHVLMTRAAYVMNGFT